jgi:tripartite-type tricarboxylate transporter receptor subunit TctC
MSDVIMNRVPVIVDGLSGPVVTGGQIKLLAIASPARLPSHPQVPTVSETVPGFTASGWFVLLGPPGTPAWIVKKVNEDLRQALDQQDVGEKFAALGVSTRAMSPEELGDFIRSEQRLWKPVINRVGLAAQ